MLRLLIYGGVMAIFIIIINILKYNNNFKNLTYESSFIDVVVYVVVCFMGGGYLGIHPISKIGKIIIILVSLFKFILLSEIIISAGRDDKYINIYKGIKDIVNMEK